MFYRAAGAAYMRPLLRGIWRVGICGRAPRPIFLLAKRPALLYNKSINKQEGTP